MVEPVEVPILDDFGTPCVSFAKSSGLAYCFGSICHFRPEFGIPDCSDMPIGLLCAGAGPDSVNQPISIDRDSEQIGRPDDFGVPLQGLNLNLATGPVDRSISVCRTRAQTYFKVVFWHQQLSWT